MQGIKYVADQRKVMVEIDLSEPVMSGFGKPCSSRVRRRFRGTWEGLTGGDGQDTAWSCEYEHLNTKA